MSGIPQTKKLWITPLSPIHMGTDEDYTPTNYVIDNDALYEFDETALTTLPKVERKKLDTILNDHATPAMLKQVQSFFYRNRDWFIPNAINVVKVSQEIATQYQARIGKAANIEQGGKEVHNRLEIERASYNPTDRRLYLPGTGLKGAMRTALLDAVNNGSRAQRGEPNRDLQQRLFDYSMRELQKDPMRLVQVGDCAWHGDTALNSAEILFAVNRKKHPVEKDGALVQSQAEQKGLYQSLECATPFRFRAFQGLLNILDLSELQHHDKQLPELRFSFGEIATACNRFYRPIFNDELEMLTSRGYLNSQWKRTVTALLADNNIQQRLKANDAFLLRVGRHSGAESVTLNGVRSIKIMKEKGAKPVYEPEAKTIWLATGDKNDQRFLTPFGWLLIEMTDLDETPPAWQSAQELVTQHSAQMTQWLADIRSKQQQLNKKINSAREEEQRKAREAAARESEAARLKAEKAAQLAREKMAEEQRLAKLAPLEREVEELPDIPAVIRALNEGKWGDQQAEAAHYIKVRMQREKVWVEQSKKKNPQKDKPYQRTLVVKQHLDQ